MSESIKRVNSDVQIPELLPVHFLLHVGGMAATIIRQQKATIAQPVDIYLNVGGIHVDNISCRGLASYLQETVLIIY